MTQQLQLAVPDPRAAHFKWDTVPRSARDWLKTRTEDIIGFVYRQACDTVRIGAILREAKSRLKHGQFQAWVVSQLPFSTATARRAMMVAQAFAAFQSAQFERFDESALYILAADRTPQACRAHAVALVESGVRVTRTVALEILDAHRDGPSARTALAAAPTKALRCLGMVREKGTRELVQCSAEVRSDGGVRFCRACRTRTEGEHVRELTLDQLRRRWHALEKLVRECEEVRIERVLDADYDPDVEVLYSVSCRRPVPASDLPRNAVRGDLYDALMTLAGVEETRCCSGPCGLDKPLVDFSKNALNPSGRNYRCRDCEKERRGAMRAEKRAKREAERARQQPPPDVLAA